MSTHVIPFQMLVAVQASSMPELVFVAQLLAGGRGEARHLVGMAVPSRWHLSAVCQDPVPAGQGDLSPGGSSCRTASDNPERRKSWCCHMLYSPFTHMCLISSVRSLQLVGDC